MSWARALRVMRLWRAAETAKILAADAYASGDLDEALAQERAAAEFALLARSQRDAILKEVERKRQTQTEAGDDNHSH
jgi:hypothetical protein